MLARSLRALGTWIVAALAALSFASLATGVVVAQGGTPSASAAPVSACTTTTGVVVAVDLRPFGGAIEQTCDPSPTKALAALKTGFSPSGTSEYGLAFICQINGDPSDQSCTSTPPVSASWTFWLANPGASAWTYSPAGASTLVPVPGSVEAWTFGSSSPQNTPTFPPSLVRATTPGPSPTTTTTAPAATTTTAGTPTTTGAEPTPTGPGRPVPGDAVPGGSGAGAAPAGGTSTPTTTAKGALTTTTQPPSTTTTAAGAPTSPTASGGHATPHPVVIAAAPASSVHHVDSSPWAAVIGALAVVALAGVAGLVAWRRRRAT